MSGITLEIARQKLDDLLEMQVNGMLAMSINGRSYTYRSLKEINEAISFWQRMVNQLERTAAGGSRVSFKLADLSGSQ